MNTDTTPQDSSVIPRNCPVSAIDVWRQLDGVRQELHTIRKPEQIMTDDRFTPQWNDLVYRAVRLSDSPEPGVSVSARALQKRMVMVVRVNLGAPGREELRRVYGF